MPITQNTKKKAVVRLYAVGHDKVDAFAPGATLYHDWPTAVSKAKELHLEPFTVSIEFDYDKITKARETA